MAYVLSGPKALNPVLLSHHFLLEISSVVMVIDIFKLHDKWFLLADLSVQLPERRKRNCNNFVLLSLVAKA